MLMGLRPVWGRESYAPGTAATTSAVGPPSKACALLEELLTGPTGSEAKAAFLGEGGVLVLLEVLDTDNERVRKLKYLLANHTRDGLLSP